jgi:hypothetical protein
MVEALTWLEGTGLSVFIREWPSIFGFPFILFLHTLGLAMLAGPSVALDAWILGTRTVTSDVGIRGLAQTMWVGFGINTLSGVALLIAYPAKALTNPLFYFKMLLVVAGMYGVQRINGELFPRGRAAAGTLVGARARQWAVVSIVIWAATIFAGRLLAYTADVLFSYELV